MREYVYHYRKTTIQTIVRRIKYQKLLIPSTFPSFNWSANQIISLFDSIYNGYPIGTFYFWELKADLENIQFHSFPRNNKEKGSEFNELYEKPNAVIDGLQRLTALYLGFYGTYTDETGTRSLCFIPTTSIEPQNKPSFFEFLTDEEYKRYEDIGETVIKVREFIINKYTTEISKSIKNLPQPYEQQNRIKSKIEKFNSRINEHKAFIYLSETNRNPDNIIKTRKQINGNML